MLFTAGDSPGTARLQPKPSGEGQPGQAAGLAGAARSPSPSPQPLLPQPGAGRAGVTRGAHACAHAHTAGSGLGARGTLLLVPLPANPLRSQTRYSETHLSRSLQNEMPLHELDVTCSCIFAASAVVWGRSQPYFWPRFGINEADRGICQVQRSAPFEGSSPQALGFAGRGRAILCHPDAPELAGPSTIRPEHC